MVDPRLNHENNMRVVNPPTKIGRPNWPCLGCHKRHEAALRISCKDIQPMMCQKIPEQIKKHLQIHRDLVGGWTNLSEDGTTVVKLESFPQIGVYKIKTCLKPPPRDLSKYHNLMNFLGISVLLREFPPSSETPDFSNKKSPKLGEDFESQQLPPKQQNEVCLFLSFFFPNTLPKLVVSNGLESTSANRFYYHRSFWIFGIF